MSFSKGDSTMLAFFAIAIVSLLVDGTFGICEKHLLSGKDEDAPLKIVVWFGIWNATIMIAFYAVGLSESGQPPWLILYHTPAILFSALCTVLYVLFYCLSIRRVKLTISETILSMGPACTIIGMILIFLLSGKMAAAKSLLTPQKGIPLIIIFIAIGALAVVSKDTKKAVTETAAVDRRPQRKKYLLVGVAFAVICMLFDSIDSLLIFFSLTESQIGSYDFMIGYGFIDTLGGIFAFAYLYIKNKTVYNPFRKTEIPLSICATGETIVDVLYIFAADMNAVAYGIMWAAYPVLPILMSRIFLKERCTWKQYLCIFVVLAMSFFLSISQN